MSQRNRTTPPTHARQQAPSTGAIPGPGRSTALAVRPGLLALVAGSMLGLAAAGPAGAAASDPQGDAEQPTRLLDDRPGDDDARDLATRPGSGDSPIAPTTTATVTPVRPGLPGPRDALPGLDGEDLSVPSGRLIREGTFLVRRVGTVLEAGTGERIFVFFPDERGHRDPPMVLLPSRTLMRMERAMDGLDEPPPLAVSGEVYVYQSRNYFLPTAFSLASPEATRPQPEATDDPSERPDVSPDDPDPRVEDLIRDLEERRGGLPAISPREATGQDDRQEAAPLREGAFITRREARLVRLPGGEWAASFDNGPRGGEGEDAPMVLMPGSTLSRLEGWADVHGEDLRMELSGRVLAYRGRNYLVPTMFVIRPRAEVRSLQ